MRLLFVDCETNGLPVNRWLPESQFDVWPDIVQISWEIWEVGDERISVMINTREFIAKPPPAHTWSKEAEAIHKIPYSMCLNEGQDVHVILSQFVADLATCDAIVGHNIDFDRKVIRAALYRVNMQASVWQSNFVELCTMRGARGQYDFGLAKDGSPKSPSLIQLHNQCIPKVTDCSGSGITWHNATHDIHCTALCFWHMCTESFSKIMLSQAQLLTGRKLQKYEIETLSRVYPYTGL